MKNKSWLFTLAVALVLTGCGGGQVNKDIELQDEESTGLSYDLVLCDRGEVASTLDVICIYDVTEIRDYSFSLDGQAVNEVYVDKGDVVSNGQLMASLNSEDTESEISELEHQIAKKELTIRQTQENKQFEIDQENDLYGYTEKSTKDTEDHKEKLADIESKYEMTLRTLNDDLTILNMRLQEKQEYFAASNIYADMDGIVSYVKTALTASTTKEGETVFEVYDPNSSKFICDDVSAGEYFEAGQTYEMTCGYGSKQKVISVEPVDMDQWTESIYFSPVDSDVLDLEINDKGHIYVTTEEKQNVLRIPVKALHLSGEQYYVYTIDSDGVRRMTYVTPGLIGDDYVEIKEGLDEGQAVVQ